MEQLICTHILDCSDGRYGNIGTMVSVLVISAMFLFWMLVAIFLEPKPQSQADIPTPFSILVIACSILSAASFLLFTIAVNLLAESITGLITLGGVIIAVFIAYGLYQFRRKRLKR